MKKFLIKVLLFVSIAITFILVGILLPTTPRASKSLLMAGISKNLLLRNTKAPRVIFVGGSNLSFGLNSQMIKDSLHLNPINTAIHAAIGIKFMLDNMLDHVQKGDIVVIAPEYDHFYRNLDAGSEELMRTIFDVDLRNIRYLNIFQITEIASYLPKYSLTKFNLMEYLNLEEGDIYSVDSFNQYGDTYTHRNRKCEKFSPHPQISGNFNYELIDFFEEVDLAVKKKGGTLVVTFPSFQETSFNNSREKIIRIERELLNSNLKIIGTAERYKMPDSLMFNTPYHLSGRGADYRTGMMICDISKVLSSKSVHEK